MKIAVAANGQGLDAQMSMFFGRCPDFVFVEIENNQIKENSTVSNTAMRQRGGAGLAAAELVGNNGASAVISGSFGPRAFGVLSQLNIKPYKGVSGTVRDNVQKYIEGNLVSVSQATGPMGRGMGRGQGGGRGQRRF